MKDLVIKQMEDVGLLSGKTKVLIAVSGGVDSVVLFHIMSSLGFELGIAHCNFQLRGEDSLSDETFVMKLASENGVPFFVKRFDLDKQKGSVQENARNLRYSWFEEVRQAEQFDVIAVGHHRDDSAETFFINLIRGTGISGLRGISPVIKSIVRPLIHASRAQITSYAEKNELCFRNDKSNDDTKYLRNKIRHDIIPSFSELSPSFTKNLQETMDNLLDVEKWLLKSVSEVWEKAAISNMGSICVDVSVLQKSGYSKLVLLQCLRQYGFNSNVVQDVVASLNKSSGKKFYSASHVLIKDRTQLLISPIDKNTSLLLKKIFIHPKESLIKEPIPMAIKRDAFDGVVPNDNQYIASLDNEMLTYPLVLRVWKEGDWFFPLGMSGKKKVSDFLIDNKVPVSEKGRVFVLESGGCIVWVVGYRIDNRYKLTEKTKNVCTFEIQHGKNK